MAIRDAEELSASKMKIDLRGPQGNAFYLLSVAGQIYRQFSNPFLVFDGKTRDEIQDDMASGDYEHLLMTFDKYFGEFVDLYR